MGSREVMLLENTTLEIGDALLVEFAVGIDGDGHHQIHGLRPHGILWDSVVMIGIERSSVMKSSTSSNDGSHSLPIHGYISYRRR